MKAHPNAVLVNWDAAANTHPNWLSTDGVHLKPAGRAPVRAVDQDGRGMLKCVHT